MCVVRVVYAASCVDETSVSVEDEEVRSPQATVRERDALVLVAQIDPREAVLLHPSDHVVEPIVLVVLGRVRVDADEAHARGRIAFGGRSRHLVRALNRGTMVAREEDDEVGRVVEVGQRVGLAVRRGKREVRRAIALIALGVSLTLGFGVYLAVQLPTILFAGTVGIWLFYIQHQFDPGYWKHDEKWDRYDAAMFGASYYKLPGILRWFTGNIGVHHLHHLQPRIPNYELYRAYTELPEAHIRQPLTLLKSFRSVRINLWSEMHERFMGFREAHRIIRQEPGVADA